MQWVTGPPQYHQLTVRQKIALKFKSDYNICRTSRTLQLDTTTTIITNYNL